MKRYDFEEEDDDDFDDDFEEEEDEKEFETSLSAQEYKQILAEEQAIQQESVELEYLSLNRKLIDTAYKICRNSFWFKFYSLDTQLKKISKVYNKLKDLQDY